MHFTKSRAVLAALAAAQCASAHTTFTEFYVNGVSSGPGVGIRMRHDASTASSPVEDLASNDMACGFDGEDGVSRVIPVSDGATVTFEFHSWPNDKSHEVLDAGHKGPCAVYLKKVDDATSSTAHGDGWFKIWDEGYDSTEQKWCTNKIIDANGYLSVALPQNLESGYYYARPELLALHNALDGDPQFYVGCAQIFIQGNGNLGPAETVSIPGHVKAGEESVSWNLYYGTVPEDYPVPGPQVASLVSGASAKIAAQTSQTKGLKPDGCILENADFCATEVPSYTDETGCWAASKNCWSQAETCWDTAPPTGGAGCTILQTKCNNLDDQCNAKNFNGPPNKGKDLTPSYTTLDNTNLWPTGNLASAPAPAASTLASSASPSYAPASSAPPAVSSPAYTPSPSSTPDYVKPVSSVTPSFTQEAAAQASPATTEAPAGYGGGGIHWVTVTQVVEVTEYEYVTVYDKYRRGHVVRRRAHHHH